MIIREAELSTNNNGVHAEGMTSQNRNTSRLISRLSLSGTRNSVDRRVAAELEAQGAQVNDMTVFDVQQAQCEAASPRRTSIRSLIAKLFTSRKPASHKPGTINTTTTHNSAPANDDSVSVDQAQHPNVPTPRT